MLTEYMSNFWIVLMLVFAAISACLLIIKFSKKAKVGKLDRDQEEMEIETVKFENSNSLMRKINPVKIEKPIKVAKPEVVTKVITTNEQNNEIIIYQDDEKGIHDVEYLLDGGEVVTEKVKRGNGLKKVPSVKEKTNYKFVGWALSHGVVINEKTFLIFEATKLTATYELVDCEITYKFVGEVKKVLVKQGECLKDIPVVTVGKTKQFTGWTKDGKTVDVDSYVVDKNIEIIALVQTKIYTVIYNYSDKSVVEKVSADDAKLKKIPTDIKKIGHTFVGWKAKNREFKNIESYIVTEDVVLEPVFNIDNYEVVFNIGGTQKCLKVPFEAKLDAYSETTKKEGHIFVGWSIDSVVLTDILGYTVKANSEFRAVYLTKQYDVVYKYNGKEIKKNKFNYGKILGVVAIKLKELQYEIIGWKDEYGKLIDTQTYKITRNIVLECSYQIKQIKINYIMFDYQTSEIIPYGEKLIHAPIIKNNKGYDFKYWLIDGQKVDLPAYKVIKDVEIKAFYKIQTYSVVYTMNNLLIGREKIEYQKGLKAVPNLELEEGYLDKGWFIDKNLINATTYVVEGPVTINFVRDIIRCNVEYIIDHKVVAREVVDYGNILVETPEAPQKVGARFGGWKISSGIVENVDKYYPAGDVKLIANFIDDYHIVTYDIQGDISNKETVKDKGKLINYPQNVKVEGYKFTGWIDQHNGVIHFNKHIVTNSEIITADFEVAHHIIVYDIGEGKTFEEKVSFNQKLKEIPKTLDIEGYSFANWKTKDAGKIDINSYIPTQNKVITAIYKENEYKIKYIMPNNEIIEETVLYKYTLKNTPPAPQKDGHVFKGWQVGKEVINDMDVYHVTGDVNLKAVFTRTEENRANIKNINSNADDVDEIKEEDKANIKSINNDVDEINEKEDKAA